jgi:hypothetical protein
MLESLESFADDMLPKYVEEGGVFPAVIAINNRERQDDLVRGLRVFHVEDYPIGFSVIVSLKDIVFMYDDVINLPKRIAWEGNEFSGKIRGAFECHRKH